MQKCETQASFRYFYRRNSVLILNGKSNGVKIRIWLLIVAAGFIEIPWRPKILSLYSWFSDNAESMDGTRTEPRNRANCLYRIADCSHLASKDQWTKGALDRRERSAGSHYITAVSTFKLGRIAKTRHP